MTSFAQDDLVPMVMTVAELINRKKPDNASAWSGA